MGLQNLLLTWASPICDGYLANWRRRTRIIDYCVDVLDASYEENKHLADQANDADLRARRKAKAELYSADIKVGDITHLISHAYAPLYSIRRSAHTTPQRAHRRNDCSGKISERYEPCLWRFPGVPLMSFSSLASAVQVLRAAKCRP